MWPIQATIDKIIIFEMLASFPVKDSFEIFENTEIKAIGPYLEGWEGLLHFGTAWMSAFSQKERRVKLILLDQKIY